MITVLLVDDDPLIHDTLAAILPAEYRVVGARTAPEFYERIDAEPADVVLMDVALGTDDGIELVRQVNTRPGAPPMVMISAHDDIELVVEAMRAGAVDYLIKPLALDKLSATVRQAVALRRRPAAATTEGLIGSSPQMQRIREEVAMYAPANSPVVVSGESGVGKEVVARSLHASSPRAGQPWVAINCGAIAPTIVEAELFGSERGAYTDAVSRPGCFERADNGTLFLDEIGEMGTDLQVKLLRVLEAQEVTRIGGTRTKPVDVRTIAATNAVLSDLMGAGRFRDDLYYRLGVLLIHVPPLRERLQDIVQLAYHFLPPHLRLTPRAIAKLGEHHWPGNVRELRNVMERATLLASVQPGDRRTVDANAIRFQ